MNTILNAAVSAASMSLNEHHYVFLKKLCQVGLFYCPPTKLGEGNVFTGVCHSVHRGWISVVPGPFWGVGMSRG